MSYHVLVVEDERPLLDLIKDALEEKGFEVVSATRTSAARNFLEDGLKPDIVWLDHYLPEETGFAFATQLKEHDTYKHIPIFLVSNTAGEQKVNAYLQLGIEKYYTKSSVHLNEIIDDIVSSLENNT